MKAKPLSKVQFRTLEEIKSAPVETPATAYGNFKCAADYRSQKTEKVWKGGLVYGRWNTATLKAIEAAGHIKIHEIGGVSGCDAVEIIS